MKRYAIKRYLVRCRRVVLNLSAPGASRVVARGYLVLVLGFGGFLVWASLAPLDQGLPANGWVVTDGQRKTIQHLQGGVVDAILVSEGESVSSGQTLVRLNPIQAQSDLDATRSQLAGAAAQVNSLATSVKLKKDQLASIGAQVNNMNVLAREGVVPKNRAMELDRQRSMLAASLADDEGQLNRVRKQQEELAARINSHAYTLEQTEIRSPVDGAVVNLSVFTHGGVVAPGGKLMEIVPTDQPLVVEGQLPVNLIDKAHAGEAVELLFTAFNQNRTPHVPATLTMVGSDRLTEERSGMPYYKIFAEVTPEGMALLRELQVRPGMPVEIFIKTGERTLMSYLFRPVIDRLHSALREE